MNFIITGGAGFIGSALIRYLISETSHNVLNIDNLTYAGNLESLSGLCESVKYKFLKIDICNAKAIDKAFEEFKPNYVIHLAAESHVDRSIDNPSQFINTNIFGTYTLLESSRKFWEKNPQDFKFIHVSTDEVFGDLMDTDELFTEKSPYDPSSPYSASKASSDHLARAWNRTYGLPVIVTNCSNNYGPYQFPEKLIPHILISAIKGNTLPIYGNGKQVRDWLYVYDHVKALIQVAKKGIIGETYNIGGFNEITNIKVVENICSILEELVPKQKGLDSYYSLVDFVDDRPGHDYRYAIDSTKIQNTLGWKPQETFETGLKKTIEWYLSNESWWTNVIKKKYNLERLGVRR